MKVGKDEQLCMFATKYYLPTLSIKFFSSHYQSSLSIKLAHDAIIWEKTDDQEVVSSNPSTSF